MTVSTRGTIFLEEGRVLKQSGFGGEQFVIRIQAPQCARHAEPGSFAHVTCHPTIPLRRPLSLMRADREGGWVEILYKVEGAGLHALAQAKPGETLSMLGPIGRGFELHRERPRTLLLGGGVGIPPVVFLAERLKDRSDAPWQPLVLMGSEIPFPFETRAAARSVDGIAAAYSACMPLLDEWNIASRLATLAGFAGCYPGFVTELADLWLKTLATRDLAQVEIFACGPTAMLAATARLARRHGVACQVSLEEFMACAVGGCAGCTVEVSTPDGPAMKRVCVDGPVFDAYAVFPAAD